MKQFPELGVRSRQRAYANSKDVHRTVSAPRPNGSEAVSKRDWNINDPQETYWFNTRTNQVEEGRQSLSIDRLGPFDTREEAERALEIVAERARRIREEDERDD